jgi:hypothetical protein
VKNTPEEIEKRRKAVEYAIKSHEMEGFEFTKEELEVFERYIQGEITTEYIINGIKDMVAEWRITRPEIFWKEGEPGEKG